MFIVMAFKLKGCEIIFTLGQDKDTYAAGHTDIVHTSLKQIQDGKVGNLAEIC